MNLHIYAQEHIRGSYLWTWHGGGALYTESLETPTIVPHSPQDMLEPELWSDL